MPSLILDCMFIAQLFSIMLIFLCLSKNMWLPIFFYRYFASNHVTGVEVTFISSSHPVSGILPKKQGGK